MEGYIASAVILLLLFIWVIWCVFSKKDDSEKFGEVLGAAGSTRWDMTQLPPAVQNTPRNTECDYTYRSLLEGTKFQQVLPTYSYTGTMNNCQRNCELVANQLYDLNFGQIVCNNLCQDKANAMVYDRATPEEMADPNSPFYNPPSPKEICHNQCKKWISGYQIGQRIPKRLQDKYVECMQNCDSALTIGQECAVKCAFDSNCDNCVQECVNMRAVNAVGSGFSRNY